MPSQRATGLEKAVRSRPGPANATGSTIATETARNSTILAPNAAGAGSLRSRGPVSGVEATTNRPAARAQQVSGAAASEVSTERPPMDTETCTVASTIPPANQAANAGNHMVCNPMSRSPAAIAATQPPVNTTAPAQSSTTVRRGRQTEPRASTANSGNSR
ncbi:hypothetical protein Ate02nite_55370 [Paractinoplanes tereljensis]|uniref:Uncharacterized protein n=1 Tax=Paractinoplanes tereljensis TaxID=571912 RepID=A0A919TWE4_9ACTN|nr:hypothetical protein Ate02nite_55370 [Actinoplanes tereljensis]